MRNLPIQGEYPPDWPEIGDRVRAEVGHRCIRCLHPYKVGEEENRGEWSKCDERCSHGGPLSLVYADAHGKRSWKEYDGDEICMARLGLSQGAGLVKEHRLWISAKWRILTVHHFDGNKANCEWWNLLALCQRCHLTIQSRVNPENPYFLEHSAWAKPYVAGFYAWKYEGKKIDRQEAEKRMDELLAYERIA